jgi:hypothetical protein
MRRKVKAERDRYKDTLVKCYWMIRGEDAAKELLAVEREISKALTE